MNAPPIFRSPELASLFRGAEIADLAPRNRRALRIGYAALAMFAGIFIIWSVLAPLEGAAVATGLVRADGGGRRTVQHLEGGIVSRILVREGEQVRAGQPLVLLDDTQSGAQQSALQAGYDSLLAQDARLSAERAGAAAITYPAELTARAGDPAVRAIIAASDAAFRARRAALAGQIDIIRQRVGGASAELGSATAQIGALDDQSRLLDGEIGKVRTLVAEGLERESRLLALQRQATSIAGQRSQLVGAAGRTNKAIAENQAQMAFLRGQLTSDAALEQRAVRAELESARQKLIAGRDISQRRQVVAPVDGKVVGLRIVTPGGVIGAGQPILDIVPTNEPMVVVARLKASDIDVVAAGLDAEVRLTPFKARVIPLLRGQVRRVAADATWDEQTRTLYYETEILLDADQLRRVTGLKLVSGMPAEVFVKLGPRTLFQYFLQPVSDSFRRAFRDD
ncbi:HlyD family type I secretion periplasmic adaptor subunit [Sphingomonas changnyeongensis]|uniref:Membrane fusion protein (MFP) family protein n=1 Tax=Sphingomonas changnyeongensis TaxID=2698679 RepID=A0A7Z2NWF1_9SPHN|nr:HlyD family type I secretion periplasmic adaptor subunit [Sphingomonas changnyeongensis]QHL90484.1 HlyD family type I secretion periplasmic adaptor subunit [Sphingomonas changnyeongensis]